MGNAYELAMAASKRNRATASGIPEERFFQDAEALLSIIKDADRDEVVLLSTEWFSNLSEAEWLWLVEFLAQTRRDISTVTYFRPQVDQISSALGQFIKSGSRPTLANCVRYMSKEPYLSAMAYHKIQSKLPIKNSVIALYNRSNLFEDDITADFLAHTDRIAGTRSPCIKTESEVNPSLNGEALTLLYSINRSALGRNENALVLDICMRIPEFSPMKNRPQLILSKKNVEEAQEIFAKDNACAVEAFGESFTYLSRDRAENEEFVDVSRGPSETSQKLFWNMWEKLFAEASDERRSLMTSLAPKIADALAQDPVRSEEHHQELAAAISQKLDPQANISDKAILGKDGFLFLGGPDSNSIAKYFSGEKKISTSAVNIHRHNFRALERTGAPYSTLIIPEAHVVYGDLLPDNFRVVENRPINSLLTALNEPIIYPIDQLMALRSEGIPVYTGRDSHYTEHAAIACYKAVRLSHGLEGNFTPPYTPSIDRESADLMTGDAAAAIKKKRILQSQSRAPHFIHLYCNNVMNNGRISIYMNPRAHGGRVLCFGTSFSDHLIPAYTSDFREVVFCYSTAVDEALVRLVEPERIFMEMPERFLHFPNMALAGSVLCTHSMRTENQETHPAFFDLPPGPIKTLVTLLSELVDSEVVPPSLGSAIGPAALARVRFARTSKHTGAVRDAIRAVLSGHYRQETLLGVLAQAVDSGLLAGECDILPETDMGGITKIRCLSRGGKYREAAQVLERHMTMFGKTTESAYFTEFLLKNA